MTTMRDADGFTLVELMVSAAITAGVMACVFLIVAPVRAAFTVQPEAADVQQRVRVSLTTLMRDLRSAGAGRTSDDACADEMGAAVLPYRVGDVASDPASGIYYRQGVISVVRAEPSSAGTPAEIVWRTYYVKPVPPDSAQLMRYDGRETDHPVLEDVVALSFDYFGIPPPALPSSAIDPVPLDPALFVDGPWCPDAADPARFDADLLRIRRIRIRLRVQATRPFRGPASALFLHPGTASGATSVPDQEIRIDIAPRNLNRDR